MLCNTLVGYCSFLTSSGYYEAVTTKLQMSLKGSSVFVKFSKLSLNDIAQDDCFSSDDRSFILLYHQLRAQLCSIESRYKAEISDLNDLLKENRRKSKEMEDELRKEINSLKAIIKDLEARLGRQL